MTNNACFLLSPIHRWRVLRPHREKALRAKAAVIRGRTGEAAKQMSKTLVRFLSLDKPQQSHPFASFFSESDRSTVSYMISSGFIFEMTSLLSIDVGQRHRQGMRQSRTYLVISSKAFSTFSSSLALASNHFRLY